MRYIIIIYIWKKPVENYTKPIIWSYWDNLDGNKTPPIIELCIQTLLNKCSKDFDIILLMNSHQVLMKLIHTTHHDLQMVYLYLTSQNYQ